MKNKDKKMTRGYAEGGVASASDLNSVFQSTMGKDIGEEGLAFYQDRLNEGRTLEELTTSIQQSPEAQAFARTVTPVTTDANTDVASASQSVTDIQAKLQELTPQLDSNPALAGPVEELVAQFNSAQQAQTNAQNRQANEARLASTALASNALTDPSALVSQATTQNIQVDPNQIVAEAPQVAASTAGPAQQMTAQSALTSLAPEAMQVTAETADTTTVSPEDVNQANAAAFTPAATVEPDLTQAEADVIINGTVAATADPTARATVRGQLASLMADFEDGEATPVWASGSMRKAMQVMQSRGMGASSVAGAAVVQAAMESAIAIGTQDAQINAQFEMQNLTNRQQTTIFKTQQRMASLFSDQAATNAALQFNASSENQTNQFFANMETEVSKFNSAQVNAILQFNTAETNAGSRFNASARGQAGQFNAAASNTLSLANAQMQTETNQFNADAANTASRVNAEQTNAQSRFNSTMRAQTDQFNASNSLVISQSNAVWRQNVATADTAAKNIANLEYTKNVNAVTGASLDQIWQKERDLMDFAFTSSESSQDRASAIFLAKLGAEQQSEALALQADMQADQAKGQLLGTIVSGLLF